MPSGRRSLLPDQAVGGDEITEPTLKLCWNGHAIRRAAEVLRAAGLQLMAEDVEAQFPKPAVERGGAEEMRP